MLRMRKLNLCMAGMLALSAGAPARVVGDEPQTAATVSVPSLVRRILLPGVAGPIDKSGIRGRIDHLAYDAATKRLFVACIANSSLEVVDLEQGNRIKSIAGLKKPQGVAIVSDLALAVVSTGGDGIVHFFDTRSFQEKAAVPVGEDADNVRIAPNGRIYIAFGGDAGPGGLAEFDPATLARTRTIHLPLRSESFQFDAFGKRVFANQPGQKRATTDGAVIAVDLTSGQLEWTSRLRKAARNFPMAVDGANRRIFVASRLPPKLVVIDDKAGTILGEAPCSPDADDVFFDKKTGCVLVIGGGNLPNGNDDGAGSALEIFAVGSQGVLAKTWTFPLPPHARTGLFVPERRAIYVAVPPLQSRPSEIREYKWP